MMSAEVSLEEFWDPYLKEKKRGQIMAISILTFKLTLHKNDEAMQQQLLNLVKEHKMAPYYLQMCEFFNCIMDEVVYHEMKSANDAVIKKRLDTIDEKKRNGSEDDVLDLLINLGHFYYEIGDKVNAIETYTKCFDCKMSSNLTLDIHMYILDVLLFHQSLTEFSDELKVTQKLVEETGDWEHRNRLNIYMGVKYMLQQDFDKVAELYSVAIPTFTSFSVFSFDTLVKYAAVTGIMHLSRSNLSKRMVDVSDVEMALLEMPILRSLLHSFYQCKYHEFFCSLLELETILKEDPYMRQSSEKIIEVLRLQAYRQFLDSFKSCTLESMAESFGVSLEFVNKELARFISEGEIHAKIDRMSNVVETQSVTSLSSLYDQIITNGTLLMNRVQTVTKTIDV